MYRKLNALFLIFILFKFAFAKIGFLGCPSGVSVVEDFQASDYLGLWYEYSKYPVVFERGGKCINAQYSLNDDESIKVVNSMQNSKGKLSSIEGKATFAGPKNEAKLKVKFPQAPVTGNYWVLKTDYKNYSVVYSCTSFLGLINFEYAWILTRARKPDEAIVKEAMSVYDKNGVSTSSLQVTDQTNCQ